jgi:hypothetical protein
VQANAWTQEAAEGYQRKYLLQVLSRTHCHSANSGLQILQPKNSGANICLGDDVFHSFIDNRLNTRNGRSPPYGVHDYRMQKSLVLDGSVEIVFDITGICQAKN